MSECVLCNVVLEVEDNNDVIFIAEEENDVILQPGNPVIVAGDAPPYEGQYEFTPTAEVQMAYTAGKIMLGNVKVNPIPNNYGLITYNGSVLTVS